MQFSSYAQKDANTIVFQSSILNTFHHWFHPSPAWISNQTLDFKWLHRHCSFCWEMERPLPEFYKWKKDSFWGWGRSMRYLLKTLWEKVNHQLLNTNLGCVPSLRELSVTGNVTTERPWVQSRLWRLLQLWVRLLQGSESCLTLAPMPLPLLSLCHALLFLVTEPG